MAANDLFSDIDPALLAAAAAADPRAAPASPDPVVATPENPSSFTDLSDDDINAALVNHDSDCTQSGSMVTTPIDPSSFADLSDSFDTSTVTRTPVAKRLRSNDRSRPSVVSSTVSPTTAAVRSPPARKLRSHDGPIPASTAAASTTSSDDSDTSDDNDSAWTPVTKGLRQARRTRTIPVPSQSPDSDAQSSQPYACLIGADMSVPPGSEPALTGTAAVTRPKPVTKPVPKPGSGFKVCPFGGHRISANSRRCKFCDRDLPVNAKTIRERLSRAQSPLAGTKSGKRPLRSTPPPSQSPIVKPIGGAASTAGDSAAANSASSSALASSASRHPTSSTSGVWRRGNSSWAKNYRAAKAANDPKTSSRVIPEHGDVQSNPATLPAFRYPDNPILHQSSDLKDLQVMLDAILPRDDNGVIGSLPALPLCAPDTIQPTDDAAYTSALRESIDPLERDLAAAMHLHDRHAHLFTTQTDPWVQICADMMAGINADTIFINTPSVGGGHTKESHVSVATIIAKLSPKATELFHNGDDRLMSLLWHLLPCALLMHDPRGAPVGKGVTSYDRRCLTQRIEAIDKHGWRGVAAAVLDWRAVAHIESSSSRSTTTELDPDEKLATVASLFSRGVALDDCIQRTNQKPTVAGDTATIAEHFRRLQEGPNDPPGPVPPPSVVQSGRAHPRPTARDAPDWHLPPPVAPSRPVR